MAGKTGSDGMSLRCLIMVCVGCSLAWSLFVDRRHLFRRWLTNYEPMQTKFKLSDTLYRYMNEPAHSLYAIRIVMAKQLLKYDEIKYWFITQNSDMLKAADSFKNKMVKEVPFMAKRNDQKMRRFFPWKSTSGRYKMHAINDVLLIFN